MVSPTTSIDQHPDIAEMRARYDRAAATPTAQIADGLGVLAGLFLALSPWIVGFSASAPLTINNLIIGFAAAFLAFTSAAAYARVHGVAWIVPVLGVWTIVAPWVVSGAVHTTKVVWTNSVVGGLILLLGMGALAVGMRRVRR